MTGFLIQFHLQCEFIVCQSEFQNGLQNRNNSKLEKKDGVLPPRVRFEMHKICVILRSVLRLSFLERVT